MYKCKRLVRIELTTSPWQGDILPVELLGHFRAIDGTRTHNLFHGKESLYQLSYYCINDSFTKKDFSVLTAEGLSVISMAD